MKQLISAAAFCGIVISCTGPTRVTTKTDQNTATGGSTTSIKATDQPARRNVDTTYVQDSLTRMPKAPRPNQ